MKAREEKEFFFREGESKEKIELIVPEMAEKKKWWLDDALTFVGIYKASSGDIVYCYPKYLKIVTDERDDYKAYVRKHMKCIVKVIDKLRSNGKPVISGDNLFDADAQNVRSDIDKLSIAKFLMRDYLSNGIYQMDVVVDVKHGNGHSKWGKTVRKVNPVITAKEAIYLDVVKRKHIRDDSGEISEIHRQILSECYETLLMRGVQQNVFVEKPRKKYNLEVCEAILRKRLNQVFNDRERAVLKAMISWCKNSPYYHAYAGTIDFANVWEWVNDAVWGNVDDQNSTSPYYTLFGASFAGTGQIKPDTISVKLDDAAGECVVDIFDSKYYSPGGVKEKDGEGLEVMGMPASADIAKQVAYRYFIEHYCAGIAKKYEERFGHSLSFRYTNSFLIPKFSEAFLKAVHEETELESDYRKVGRVSVGTFPGLIKYFDVVNDQEEIDNEYTAKTELAVDIIEVDPDSLYNRYLLNPIGAFGL